MPSSSPAGHRPISLDELIALNAEIAALARAGIPLERGLGSLRGGSGGVLIERLRQRLEQGASLPDVFAAESHQIPRAYHAVIEAGLRTGRLPEALETITGYAEMLVDLRRRLRLALIYPAIVVAVAYLLLWMFLTRLAGPIGETYRMFGLREHAWVSLLAWFEQTAIWWLVIPPAAALILAIAWFSAGMGPHGGTGVSSAGMAWFPGIGRVVRHFRRSAFAEMLAMLTDRNVPLPTALRLSGEATGDRRIAAEAGRLAADVEAGRTLRESVGGSQVFPPFMRWMMGAGEQQQALPAALRQLGEIYRRRGIRQSDWLRFLLPIGLTVFVGGGVVLCYALLLFLPLTALLNSLGQG